MKKIFSNFFRFPEKKEFFRFQFGLMFFYILLFWVTSDYVSAAGSSSSSLPFNNFYIPNYQSYFNSYTSSLNTVLSYHNVDNYDDCAIIVYENTDSSSTLYICTILLTPDNISNLVPYDSTFTSISFTEFDDFTSDFFIYNGTIKGKKWQIKKSDPSDFKSGSSSLVTFNSPSILGNHSQNSVGITYCYPIYIKGTLSVLIPGTVTPFPIFTDYVVPVDPVLPTGHAQNPYFNGESHFNPDYSGSGTSSSSSVPPSYTINNYSWTTYTNPSIDNSSVETLLQSLISVINYLAGWLSNNLSGEFSNLLSNISGFVNFLASTFRYYGDLIISNIQGLTTFLYNNFVSLFEEFTSSFSNFFQFMANIYNHSLDENGNVDLSVLFEYLFIPDPSELSDVLEDHDIYGVIGFADFLQTQINVIKNGITSGENIYKITLPQFVLCGVTLGPYDIDFSWYLNYKSVGDPIISAFLIFGWFMWAYHRLPYWFRSQQGDVTGTVKEVQK